MIELRWLKMPKDWQYGRYKLQYRPTHFIGPDGNCVPIAMKSAWIDVPVTDKPNKPALREKFTKAWTNHCKENLNWNSHTMSEALAEVAEEHFKKFFNQC